MQRHFNRIASLASTTKLYLSDCPAEYSYKNGFHFG